MNTCKANFHLNKYTKSESLHIEQIKHNDITLKHHYMNIAFFDILGDATIIELRMQNEVDSYISFNGRGFYKAVLTNFQDKAFIKIELDEVSLKFFKENVTRLKDNLAKSMIWYAFFEMVFD